MSCLSSRNQKRIWYNALSGDVRFPMKNNVPNHTLDVVINPDIFSVNLSVISQEALEYSRKYDYCGEVLYAAQVNGWVRIFIDHRNTKNGFSNVEGTNVVWIANAMIWLNQFCPGFDGITIALRNGIGNNHGDKYFLSSRQQIDFLIEYKKIPPNTVTQIGDLIDLVRISDAS